MKKDRSRKTMEVDGWQVSNLPVKHSMEDYEKAREEIVRKIEGVPGLNALFEYGWVAVPGISDIDCWAVFDDNAETMHIPSEPVLSNETFYLMKHLLTVICEKHYKKMLYFEPWMARVWPNGQRLLYQRDDIKRDLNFERLNFTPEESEVLSALGIEELLGSVYSLIPLYVQKKLRVRDIFESLKDCTYVTRDVNALSQKKIDSDFSNEFNKLREQWFEMDEVEASRRLIKIFEWGLSDGFKVAFSLANWLDQHCQSVPVKDLAIRRLPRLKKSLGRAVYSVTPRSKRVFSDSVDNAEKAFKLSVESYKKIEVAGRTNSFYIAYQPLGMASIPLGTASGKGLLSDGLRSTFFTNLTRVGVFQPDIFKKKVEMLNEITEIYNRKQRPNSYGKGYLWGNNHFGFTFRRKTYKSRLLNLYLKYRFWRAV